MKKIVFLVSIGILGATFPFFLGVEEAYAARSDIAAPISPSPADNATAAMPVTFQWSPVTFPGGLSGGYVLELRGQNLSFAFQDRMHWVSTNSFAIGTVLLAGTEYTWRVRACLGFSVPSEGVPQESQCGPWSNNGILWKFTADLAKPKLLFPANTTKEPIPSPVTLRWEGVLGADTYNVEVRNLTDPFTRTFDKVASTSLAITAPNFPLNLNHAFQWKVVPLQGAKQGPVSDTWEFFVALSRPKLLGPPNGANVSYPVSQFSWDSVFKATSYTFEVFDATNSRILQHSLGGTSFSDAAAIPRPLVNKIGERYSWQVTACENTNVNCGVPSNRSNFTLVFGPPPNPSLQLQGSPSPKILLSWKRPLLPEVGPLPIKYIWEIRQQGKTILTSTTPSIDVQVQQSIEPTLASGSYTLRVKACTMGNRGCSDWSTDSSPLQVPRPLLVVFPFDAEVLVGNAQEFQVLFALKTGFTFEDKTNQASWSSSNTRVASVERGVATCQISGQANIQATLQGVSVTATLTCKTKAEEVSGPPVPQLPARVAPTLEMSSPPEPIWFLGPDTRLLTRGESTDRDPAVVLISKTDSPLQVNISVSGEGFQLLSSYPISLRPKEEHSVGIRFTAPEKPAKMVYDGTVTVSSSLGSRSFQLQAFVEVPTPSSGPAGTGVPTAPREPTPAPTGIFGVADRAANVAFTALIIAAALFVLLAAFQFVSGGGNPEAISQARDKLIWAAAGISIALVAKGVATILQNILLGPPGAPGEEPCPGPSPSDGIQNPLKTICFSGLLDSIINVIFTLSLIVVPFVVLYAGFLFVTGGGNPEQITRARNTLIWTAVGFGVILIAKGLPFILKDILGI